MTGLTAETWQPPLPPLPKAVRGVVAGAVSRCEAVYRVVVGFRPIALDVHVPEAAAPAVPGGPDDARRGVPLVVWIHGGGWEFGDRRSTPEVWPEGWLFEACVAAGLAVATVDYRLSGESAFPAAFDDVRAAVRYLRAMAPALGIDGSRVAVMGESAGGQLAALVALAGAGSDVDGSGSPASSLVAEAGDAFAGPVQAAALLYPPTDFTPAAAPISTAFPQAEGGADDRMLGGPATKRPAVAIAASPVTYARPDAPPVLLLHGDEDSIVRLDQSVRLRDALVAAGARDVVLDVVPGAEHCFQGVDPVPPLQRAVDFLSARLAG